MQALFDLALRGDARQLEHDDGTISSLAVRRWHGHPDEVDVLLIERCRGATLDVGCGPGRMTVGLTRRGLPAMGIDTSAEAVRMTVRRGGVAVQCDIFDPVPAEGQWDHVLLADCNLGIGGDLAVLLGRVHDVLSCGGSALVEVAAPGTGLREGTARFGDGPWFPWTQADAEAVTRLGEEAKLVTTWTAERSGRWLVELTRR
ncbi:methyltransferase domain-containing protein [Allosaccharopolyspora coralli]|uniref:Methyltransferase domain-containing protein n=1 Tax=Allosaccharopolyspora coralli TaxID=2665642 RepID=A0A5Q3Q7Z7_9PSEU|nr:class I SAM-dependent methyltransferase [Allosaccharopolyspora coralli]QGK70493.1 methyltransferase domain-containing protein [Allosaccharopolyspora coralli]